MEKIFCLDLTLTELENWCKENSYPAFRAKQIYKWLSSGVTVLGEMTNLPKDLKAKLDEDFIFPGMEIADCFVSKIDGTAKYVYKLYDGNIIETVVMRYKTGLSVCISSQAGCKMGCAFCASAKAGFGRSLTAGEMLAQVLLSQKDMKEEIKHVVVMGIGEPFDNYDNLIKFLKLINDSDGKNLGARHITVSTCGLIPKIREFADLKLQVNLAVSLHAPTDELRRTMMPIANRYSMKELMEAVDYYIDKTNRRVTFEYSLFKGINDSDECARALAGLLKGRLCHVNLIAANEFAGSDYHRPSQKSVTAFKDKLTSLGINATLRREMGTDIMAACGQLRRGLEGEA
ncbi:MAG: 23S rRNA (adenine(2503)-C(2))-methyltransferase RlmN [Clostridiales bacterium]|nr:23S rRNA (adenine(2503)-C(2))-methyltransferase RlmN [Clostridiales bacterium]